MPAEVFVQLKDGHAANVLRSREKTTRLFEKINTKAFGPRAGAKQ